MDFSVFFLSLSLLIEFSLKYYDRILVSFYETIIVEVFVLFYLTDSISRSEYEAAFCKHWITEKKQGAGLRTLFSPTIQGMNDNDQPGERKRCLFSMKSIEPCAHGN